MRLVYSLTAFQLFLSIDSSIVSPNGSIGDTLRHCLISQAPNHLGHCLGVGAITQLQSLDSSPEFDLVDGVTLTRNEQEYREVYNFAEGDPSSLRSLVDSFSYVFSKRNTQWDMGFIYPGLAVRMSPSVHQSGTLEFVVDPHREALNVQSLKEAGTGRLLARQFLVPLLLGFKFNVASLVPILFGLLALIAKKALIISKIALVVTSALALGSILIGNNDKYQQHHYGPSQFGHQSYGSAIYGYTRYPDDELSDAYYRARPDRQSDQLNVYPNIAKSLDRSELGEKTKGRNFAWENKEEKLKKENIF